MPAPRWLARFNRHVTNRIALTHTGWMPGMAIVHHVGRRSGTAYRTPVLIFRDGDEYVIELTYGADTDWVKNVMAAGECEVTTRRRTIHCRDPLVEDADGRPWSPGFVRVILRLLHVDKVLRLRCGPSPRR